MRSLLLKDCSLFGKVNNIILKEGTSMVYTYFVCYSHSYLSFDNKQHTALKNSIINLNYKVTKNTFKRFFNDVSEQVNNVNAKRNTVTIINWKLLEGDEK